MVLVREDVPNQKRLVGYYTVSNRNGGLADLREKLTKVLPDYMIPSAFVEVASFPLTPNGKLERKGLPAPDFSNSIGYVAPRNKVEKELQRLWEEIYELAQLEYKMIF